MAALTGEPIPFHYNQSTVTSNVYSIPSNLGLIFAAPTANATWTLPAINGAIPIIVGAFLEIVNSSAFTITLVPSGTDTIVGWTLIPANSSTIVSCDETTTWRVVSNSSQSGLVSGSGATFTKSDGTQLDVILNRSTNVAAAIIHWQTAGTDDFVLGTPSGANYAYLGATDRTFLVSLGTGGLAVTGGSSSSPAISWSTYPVTTGDADTDVSTALLSGVIVSGALAANRLLNVTAATLVAAVAQAFVGQTFTCLLVNTSGFNMTLTNVAGTTVVGNAVIAAGTSRSVRVYISNVGTPAVTIYC